MKNIFVSVLFVCSILIFQSCQKNENADENSSSTLENNLKAAVSEIYSNSLNTISTQDLQGVCIESYNGLGDAIYMDFEQGKGHGKGYGKGHYKIPHLSDCATITVSDSVYPKEIIIEYSTDCADSRHHTISGRIIITISDTLTKAGAEKTIEFEDLYIDSVKVEYLASYKNLGTNAENQWVIAKTFEQTIAVDDSTTIVQSGSDTTTWEQGYETTDKGDDVFYKTGSGSININDTLAYSRTITTPLLYDRSCEYILSGVVELYKDSKTIIIDYGDGTCDNLATVTIDGTTEEINLHSHRFGSENGKFHKHFRGFDHKH
jgi:hypothetical protein